MAMNNFVMRRRERLRQKRQAVRERRATAILGVDAVQKRDKEGKFASSAGSNAMRTSIEKRGFKPLYPATAGNLGTSVHEHAKKGFMHIHDDEHWGHETRHYERGVEIGGVTQAGNYNPKMVQGHGQKSMEQYLDKGRKP